MNLTHQNPWYTGWSSFVIDFDFASVKNSEGIILYRRVKFISAIYFHSFFFIKNFAGAVSKSFFSWVKPAMAVDSWGSPLRPAAKKCWNLFLLYSRYLHLYGICVRAKMFTGPFMEKTDKKRYCDCRYCNKFKHVIGAIYVSFDCWLGWDLKTFGNNFIIYSMQVIIVKNSKLQ